MRSYTNNLIAVILEDGEDVFGSVKELCRATKVDSALILSGIGMLRQVKIGYWNGEGYQTRQYAQPMELVSMSGSIATQDGELSVHMHVSLAGQDHAGIAGHLVEATVNNINELSIAPFPSSSFTRKYSQMTKLNMLNFAEK